MNKTHGDFLKLKKGQRVYDTWYGPGVVERVLKTRIRIRLFHPNVFSPNPIWSYDKAHVNGFIKIGRGPK